MAVKTTLKWNGDIKKDDMNKAVLKALTKAGLVVVAEAKRLAPVKTSQLENSIHEELKPLVLQMEVKTNLDYAIYVEFGTGSKAENGLGRQTPWVYYNELVGHYVRTSGMKAQPFMRPALKNNKTNIKTIFIEEGRKAI